MEIVSRNQTKMTDNRNKLFIEERREQIVALLYQQQRITVDELCHRFAVSEVTIRKDLAWLEKHNNILRTHGGALWVTDSKLNLYKFKTHDY